MFRTLNPFVHWAPTADPAMVEEQAQSAPLGEFGFAFAVNLALTVANVTTTRQVVSHGDPLPVSEASIFCQDIGVAQEVEVLNGSS